MLDNTIEIYTDGTCLNNGKENSIATIGIYFPNKEYENISKKLKDLKLLGFDDRAHTNNTGELFAILEALNIVKNENKFIKIYSDSLYSINTITKVWNRNKNLDILYEIDNLNNNYVKNNGTLFTINFEWVKGHTGNKDGNYYADELANNALNKNEKKQLEKFNKFIERKKEEKKQSKSVNSFKNFINNKINNEYDKFEEKVSINILDSCFDNKEIKEKQEFKRKREDDKKDDNQNNKIERLLSNDEYEILNLFEKLTKQDKERMKIIMQQFINISD